MRISAFRSLVFLHFPLLIISHPRAPLVSLDTPGSRPATRAVPQVLSILQSLNETQHLSHSSSSSSPGPNPFSLAEINYPVKGTPVDLTITLKGPPVPQIYISACLTAALRRIAPNVTTEPSDPIPNNRFDYRDRTSGVHVEYIGFIDLNWLTWQQLSWALFGLLTFVEKREANSRALDAWVFIKDGGYWAKPYGSLALGYNGYHVSEER